MGCTAPTATPAESRQSGLPRRLHQRPSPSEPRAPGCQCERNPLAHGVRRCPGFGLILISFVRNRAADADVIEAEILLDFAHDPAPACEPDRRSKLRCANIVEKRQLRERVVLREQAHSLPQPIPVRQPSPSRPVRCSKTYSRFVSWHHHPAGLCQQMGAAHKHLAGCSAGVIPSRARVFSRSDRISTVDRFESRIR